MESVTPSNYSTDVPLNAVVKAVLVSDGEIEENSITGENFNIFKVTDVNEKEDTSSGEKKTPDTASTTKNSREETQGGRTPISVILLSSSEHISVKKGDTLKDKIRTTVYCIPSPGEKSSKAPLDKLTTYVFSIGELKDKNGNILTATESTFKTTDTGFEFSSTPKIKSITPAKAADGSITIAKNQGLLIEFDGPVNPFKLRDFSKVYLVEPKSSLDISAFSDLESETRRQINENIKVLDDTIKLLEEAHKDQNSSESDRAEAKQELAQAREEKKALVKQLMEVGGSDEGAGNAGEDKASKEALQKLGKSSKEKNPIDFYLSFLEEFKAASGVSDNFVRANYNRALVSAGFEYDSMTYYELVLSLVSKGAPPLSTNQLFVNKDIEYDESKIIQGFTKVDFFSQNED